HDMITRAYEGAEQAVPLSKQEAAGGWVDVAFLDADSLDTDDVRRKGGLLTMPEFRELACRRTFAQVEDWLRQGVYAPGAIGILVRTNQEAKMLVDYFKYRQAQGGLYFPVISGDALLLSGHPAIKAIVATLRFMAFEGREYNGYLGDLVFHYAEAKSLAINAEDWFAIGRADLSALRSVLPERLVQHWNDLKQMPLTELVERLIDLFGFGDDGGVVPYLLAFRDVVARFVASGMRGLQRFLEAWDDESDRLPLPMGDQSGAVEILTIHKSKGLAYDVVMIPFCCWSLDGRSGEQVWFDVSDTEYGAFERMPLPYGTHVRQSPLYPQYYQEKLYNFM